MEHGWDTNKVLVTIYTPSLGKNTYIFTRKWVRVNIKPMNLLLQMKDLLIEAANEVSDCFSVIGKA